MESPLSENAPEIDQSMFKSFNNAPNLMAEFEKICLLGKGDVGKVYLVRHRPTGKEFAMKVLTKTEMIARNKVKRVLTEREILSTADHPFIVTMHYCFQTEERLVFIMDFCGGGEFFRMLQRQPNKCLPEEQARFYAAEVLMALEYLHMKGFIYRDLKPENILLHGSGHLMLTDFDLSKHGSGPVSTARVVDAHAAARRSSKLGMLNPMVLKSKLLGESKKGEMIDTSNHHMLPTNSFVGTEEYIAPEVIEGRGYTSTVDWWTYGILLYEMLFGMTPFKGRTQQDTFEKIVYTSKDLKFPEHPKVSKNCQKIIKALLQPDISKRLGSKNGAAGIKMHPWFKGINWALLRNEKPAIIPNLTGPMDLKYFNRLEDTDGDDIFQPESKKKKKGKGKGSSQSSLA